MAFGSGVLISTLAVELMEDAFEAGGFDHTAIGFLGGAAVYTAANWYICYQGAHSRKRSCDCHPQASEDENRGSGLAIAAGALLDGIPESIVIGTSLLAGGAVSWVAVTAVFLSVFVVQLFIYGFHELTEANLFPYSEPLHWATEPYGPDGRYGQFLSYGLLALPLGWLIFAALFGGKKDSVSPPVQQTAAR